jgi:hypothetical protein
LWGSEPTILVERRAEQADTPAELAKLPTKESLLKDLTIRAGLCRPLPRYWEALRRLAGVSAKVLAFGPVNQCVRYLTRPVPLSAQVQQQRPFLIALQNRKGWDIISPLFEYPDHFHAEIAWNIGSTTSSEIWRRVSILVETQSKAWRR